MAINNNNLGYKVTSRQLDWTEMVIQQWGVQWNMNDIAYEFGNGRKFESTDKYTSGIYTRT